MEVSKYSFSPSVFTTKEGFPLLVEQEAGWTTLFGGFGNTENSLVLFSNQTQFLYCPERSISTAPSTISRLLYRAFQNVLRDYKHL